MNIKWFGAALIIAGCGGFGFAMAAGIRQQIRLLTELGRILDFFATELQYRLTPLPELTNQAAEESGGILKKIFGDFSERLAMQLCSDAASCMDAVLERYDDLPVRVRRHLRHLGHSLGKYDLPGQLRGLQTVQEACKKDLTRLQNNSDIRQRSYQTLALCAGSALVILFV